jgi:hypothetical protein
MKLTRANQKRTRIRLSDSLSINTFLHVLFCSLLQAIYMSSNHANATIASIVYVRQGDVSQLTYEPLQAKYNHGHRYFSGPGLLFTHRYNLFSQSPESLFCKQSKI